MKTLILTNDLKKLKKGFSFKSQPFIYVKLSESLESNKILDYIKNHPNANEIPAAPLITRERIFLKETFSNLISRLNIQYARLTWWAMPFTDKNPVLRPIFADICQVCTIQKLVSSSPENIIVISENQRIIQYLKKWTTSNNIHIKCLVRRNLSIKPFLERYLLAAIIFAFAKTLAIYFLCRAIRLKEHNTQPQYIVMSLSHPRSFEGTNPYNDQYFGALVPFLSESKINYLVIVLMIERPFWQIKKMKTVQESTQILPVESYLTLRDIFRCFTQAIYMHIHNVQLEKTPIYDNEPDYNFLVSKTIGETCRSGNVLMNLRVYYAAKRLSKSSQITQCIYPYENRSWEKMLVQGFSEHSPNTTLVGYQHAAITQDHTHFVIGSEELQSTPLPHKILTTGPFVKDWMSLSGDYPASKIESSCALRQPTANQINLKQREKILNHILVVLSGNAEEYRRVLHIVSTTLLQDSNFHIRIRPHPAIPITSILTSYESKPIIPFISNTILSEDLDWADVVVYCSSTVGVESVSRGIPTLHIDIGTFLYNDPMFGFNVFKWDILKYEDLIPTIKQIENMPSDEFKNLQDAALTYSANYLAPVSKDLLHKFIEE